MKNVKVGNHKPVRLVSFGIHSYLFQKFLDILIFRKGMSKHIISPPFKMKVPYNNTQTIIVALQKAEPRVHNNCVCFLSFISFLSTIMF